VVTDAELGELLTDCPTLFHMAEDRSWPSIRERGLLSTTALLDLYGSQGAERERIEAQRRSAGVVLEHPSLPRVVIRDQLPMDDGGLRRCLPAHIEPTDWYRLLNGKVFFWLTRRRLFTLLNARPYRRRPHDVIELSTQRLVERHYDHIWFCPMNSGCTKPIPHPRDDHTFERIPDYDYAGRRHSRRRDDRVVELSVDYSVPDISDFVTRAVRMQGREELGILPL
jgi:hypothetical protein